MFYFKSNTFSKLAGLYFLGQRLFQSSMDTGDNLPPVINGEFNNTSFCFKTITERWPKIITKIIDQMHKYYEEAVKKYGEQGGDDVKYVISKIAEMRYLIATDKQLTDISTDAPDAELWNSCLNSYRQKMGESNVTWFKLPWLFVESFLYRKLYEFFTTTIHLKNYDYFSQDKQKSFQQGVDHMKSLGAELIGDVNKNLTAQDVRSFVIKLLQISLWGNKCDLSMSGGDSNEMSSSIFEELDELRNNILQDDLDQVCDECIMKPKSGAKRIDIVLDNAGLELFTDLALADFMLSKNLANEVIFHGKAFPWFVSDTLQADFDWVMQELADSGDENLKKLGGRWRDYVSEMKFQFKAHPFWTQGFAYFEMREVAPDLYADLSASDLLIFKGDLNYRKLVGDRYWPYKTPFKTALRGFEPTSFLTLRTLKAETVAGLSDKALEYVYKKFGKDSKEWMVTGDYAVAQLFVKSS